MNEIWQLFKSCQICNVFKISILSKWRPLSISVLFFKKNLIFVPKIVDNDNNLLKIMLQTFVFL
jgi:hypothetical protein